MKKVKLSPEELEQMSHADVANIVLKENGKKMTIQDLFKEVIRIMSLPESYFESKIGDFFGLLSTDKRFIMLEKGFWDLKDNHSTKVIIEDEEEDDIVVDEDEEVTDEIVEEEINYDDDTVDDDDDEDDLKDLVIMDDGESEDMM
ncbi:MAG: DNA-directed RNA polymerase subunit delta [Bacilli bacterium]|jgi:DNA-directed RNA polymerase subunit delta|nr:DNA-directed RNA polymerase subunit delta [Bacilli bacterium]